MDLRASEAIGSNSSKTIQKTRTSYIFFHLHAMPARLKNANLKKTAKTADKLPPKTYQK